MGRGGGGHDCWRQLRQQLTEMHQVAVNRQQGAGDLEGVGAILDIGWGDAS
jgi:hypothetical protein